MSASSKTVKEFIARAKSYIQRNDYLRTLKALCQALELLQGSQIFGRERFEVNVLLDEALRDLSGMKQIKRVFPQGIHYEKGQEKALWRTLTRMHDKLEAAIEKVRVEKIRAQKLELDEMLMKAQDFLSKKEPLEARKLFRKASELYPEEKNLPVDIGNRLMMAGLFVEALEYFKRGMEVDSSDPRPYQFSILCHEATGELDKAEEVVKETLRRFGGNESIYLRMAKLALQKRQWSEAYDVVAQALQLNPTNQEGLKILKQVGPRIFGAGFDPTKSLPSKAPKGTGEDAAKAPTRAPGAPIKLDL